MNKKQYIPVERGFKNLSRLTRYFGKLFTFLKSDVHECVIDVVYAYSINYGIPYTRINSQLPLTY